MVLCGVFQVCFLLQMPSAVGLCLGGVALRGDELHLYLLQILPLLGFPVKLAQCQVENLRI